MEEALPVREEEEVLDCTVRAVVYTDVEQGYSVLRVTDTDGTEQTLTGFLPFAWPGETITAYGHWTNHETYGRQFRAESAERSLPEDPRAIYFFLASDTVKGIGPILAGLIVEKFQNESLRVLENEPRRLAEIRGISLKKAEMLSKEYRRQAELKKLILFLSANGIAPEYAARLYRLFGSRARELLNENPYLLTEDGIGAPFGIADSLAAELGISDTDPHRIQAGLCYVLRHNEQNGHCFIPYEKLCAAAAKQLGLETEDIVPQLEEMTCENNLIREQIAGVDACYLPELYFAEKETAERIAGMAAAGQENVPHAEDIIAACEKEMGLTLAERQKEILRKATANRILVVTGGPGTGKTTSLRVLVRVYESLGLRVLLAAPTGRAAKRMHSLTGADASTIHRLLEAKPSADGTGTVFGKNRENPLRCDVMIVDECSMVDLRLMHALLKALPEEARLILVGDASQLPAVGPGDVFSAILRSGVVPSVRLNEIFRQNDGSHIVRNAHMINHGEHPDLSENTGDFFRLQRLQAGTVAETIVELFAVRLPRKMHIPPEEIQVLSPTRRGDCGTEALNRMLQAALNPPAPGKKEVQVGGAVFREGDRVIQTRNNYEVVWEETAESSLGIFNGDIGTLVHIDREEERAVVDFDGRRANYGFDMLSDLEHAWALTVHKSQGSEYRAVILALSDAAGRLLNRTVLYTAITRAKELLIMVGNEALAFRMIDNTAPTKRYNALRIRIRAAAGQ